ncbi:uncharacterized protein K460DRAFT_365085 [Cucurbitaria berberidis CBS 394.84]|uniref:MYND-type domain-containing protein n=1 Tax=Cucurbitaria berberidis CBS 394.84 TaxID=1168544 RepID=A0A9P4GQ39_9PLEO|nr:uncharacterized protein K460DRAFT_365085 [Cucurbitaria berberidis CBS 394.84]KAF1849175.1 hypothetical protein K460DRAFT_365085 [Cucurbitaria berberidis CBS 394.84]
MAEPASDTLCAICPALGSEVCSSCHGIRYCSKACQKVDWPVHKLLCKKFSKDFSNDKRPQQPEFQFKRAIYFPEEGNGPQYIWLPSSGPSDEGRAVAHTHILGLKNTDLYPIDYFKENAVLHRQIDGDIVLLARIHDLNTNEAMLFGNPNKSLAKIDKELTNYWKGPLLAYGARTDVGWPDQCYDLGPVDLRHVVDYLSVAHSKRSIEQNMYTIGDGEKTRGVRFNCVSDQQICQRTQFEPMDILKSVCDGESELKATVAEKAGFPLVFRKLTFALCWRSRSHQDFSYAENPSAAFFDPGTLLDTTWLDTALRFGNPTSAIDQQMKFAKQMGSLIVVRKDGEPLTPMLMKALTEYAQQKTNEAFESENEPHTLASQVLDSISPERFRKWYSDFLFGLCEDPSVGIHEIAALYDI